MQVGNLKTGLLYDNAKVPSDCRWWHRVGTVEVLREGYSGEKVGLVNISHDPLKPYWDFAEIGSEGFIL